MGLILVFERDIIAKNKRRLAMKADCHMHMILDGVDWKASIARHRDKPDLSFIKTVLSVYQEQGYTYLPYSSLGICMKFCRSR